MHRATKDHAATGNGEQAEEADQPAGRAEEPVERLAFPVPAAAKAVGISARRMWDLVLGGKVRSFREGQRRLISRGALEAYIAEREKESA